MLSQPARVSFRIIEMDLGRLGKPFRFVDLLIHRNLVCNKALERPCNFAKQLQARKLM